jgi:outer membrane protein assembly factor BamB/orotate phosphoribosyltransferase
MKNNIVSRELLRKQIINHGVTLGEYAPGRYMRMMLDIREALQRDDVLAVTGELMWERIKKYNPTVIYGCGYGSVNILISTKIAAEKEGTSLMVLIVRETRKETNRFRLVEGPRPKKGSIAVFLDDIINSGTTYRTALLKLAEEDIELNTIAVGCIYDFWSFKGSRRLEAQGMAVERIFTRHDIGDTRIDSEKPVVKEIVWRHLAHNTKSLDWGKPPPTIYTDKVYFANDSHKIFCHDIKSGEIIWEFTGPKPDWSKGIGSKLVIDNDYLYFTSYDGCLYKLHAETGNVIWHSYLDMYLHSTPFIAGDSIYVGTEGGIANQRGDIVCLDTNTGITKWRFPTNHVVPCSPNLIFGQVICGSNDRNLYSINPSNGLLNWKLEDVGEIKGRASYIDDVILVSNERGKLYGVSLEGKILWVRSTGTFTHHQFLEVNQEEGLVYIVNRDGLAAAYDKHGNQIWLRKLRGSGNWNIRFIKNELIIITITGHINLLNPKTGDRIKSNQLGYNTNTPPDFDDDYIAVHSLKQGFYIYRRNND